MSATYIGVELRRQVVARSEELCEYCLIAEADTFYGCNQAKGSDIGSIHWDANEFVRFYNPRTDRWADHFELVGSRIDGLTPIGLVTARILGFNTGERVLERQTLQSVGRYPSPAAMRRMQA